MHRRFLAIWFRHLTTDWWVRKHPELKDTAFLLAAPERGRMIVKAVSSAAQAKGIYANMVVADCRTIFPALQVFDHIPGLERKLLQALAEWCIRYTPVAAVDMPDGLMLDISGCAHLWGGEHAYLKDILNRLRAYGYDVRAAIADTIGAAWGIARYGKITAIITPGTQATALMPLPPHALRLDAAIIARLEKLGLYQVQCFMNMPRSALRRRFGQQLLSRLDQALGQEIEVLEPVCPIIPYQERLPVLEPICTATGIEIALKKMLDKLCTRFTEEGIGLRTCVFKGYRIDGNIQQIQVGTTRPSSNAAHLFKLFELKIPILEPGLGFELFILEATKIEDIPITQDALWNESAHDDVIVSELLDKITGKVGADTIRRYLPAEHYWPERSVTIAASIQDKPAADWRTDIPRPIHILYKPEPIEVSVPIPDYPPMLFIYKGKLHHVSKADGPERIEQEWWIEEGLYRDYYCVEDDKGNRYWLFRSGHYNSREPKWFMHGFFA